MQHSKRQWTAWWPLWAVLVGLGGVQSWPTHADSATPKVLYMFVEDRTLIASNALFSRFDRLRLLANERIEKQIVAEQVAVVATNQRIVFYSALISAWQIVKRRAREDIHDIQAVDFSASVVTSDRFLNFNGRNAVWAETRR